MTDTPTLKDLLRDIFSARGFIMVFALAGAVAAGLFVYMATPYYRAQMIVSPANPMNGAEVSSLLADDNLFALRYLVQRVGVANSSDFMRFENVYDGQSVATALLKDERITEGLSQDRMFPFSRSETQWNAAKLAEYIDERVRLEPVGATPMRRLAYYHPDPTFAVYFIQAIHTVSDTLIRRDIHTNAAQRVQYLQDAVGKTNNPEHRRALTTLLLEQERLRMLVSIEQSYAASVIEPAASSYKPRWPDKALVFAALVFAGALAGFVIWSIRQAPASAALQTSGVRRKWFQDDSANTQRPLTSRDAAE